MSYTQFAPSSDSRLVYVSSVAGSSTRAGSDPRTAVHSLAAGIAQLRHGYPDWLLLRRGDTFVDTFGQWKKSGRSPTEPMLIASYGSQGIFTSSGVVGESLDRPTVLTGDQDGLYVQTGGGSPAIIENLAISGIKFRAHTNTGATNPSGVGVAMCISNWLVEDCEFDSYEVGVRTTSAAEKTGFTVRRCVIHDCFATSGTVGHGIYLARTHNALIEENVLDHNGWNESIAGAIPTDFRHGIYMASGGGQSYGAIVRRNLIHNSAGHGLHFRSGGQCTDNCFAANSIALNIGWGDEPTTGGIDAIVENNTALEGKNIDVSNARGWAWRFGNTRTLDFHHNVASDGSHGGAPHVFVSEPGDGSPPLVATLRDNVNYNWGSAGDISDEIVGMPATVTHYGNQGWDVPTVTYPDPARSLATYAQLIGVGSTRADLVARARLMGRFQGWDDRLLGGPIGRYIRAGFGI